MTNWPLPQHQHWGGTLLRHPQLDTAPLTIFSPRFWHDICDIRWGATKSLSAKWRKTSCRVSNGLQSLKVTWNWCLQYLWCSVPSIGSARYLRHVFDFGGGTAKIFFNLTLNGEKLLLGWVMDFHLWKLLEDGFHRFSGGVHHLS
jgi:hypothetical protein